MSDNFDLLREMKAKINFVLNTSMLVGTGKRLRNDPETAKCIREEPRRVLRDQVYATENRALVLYFEKRLAETKAT